MAKLPQTSFQTKSIIEEAICIAGSISKLSRATKINRASICKWVRMDALPNLSHMIRIANWLAQQKNVPFQSEEEINVPDSIT